MVVLEPHSKPSDLAALRDPAYLASRIAGDHLPYLREEESWIAPLAPRSSPS